MRCASYVIKKNYNIASLVVIVVVLDFVSLLLPMESVITHGKQNIALQQTL